MTRREFLVIPVAGIAAGCGRYADFVLPPADAGGPRPPFQWTALPEPVLGRGDAGAWDSSDVLNPSVARFRGKYLNLYSGFDGRTWRTGLATSADGVAWRKQGEVLSPAGWEGAYIAANGAALADGGSVSYWYQAGEPSRIALARSSDGVDWQKHGGAVLSPGPSGSFDERGVADPCVIRAGANLYLFYLGMDRAGRQRIGVARSLDGVRWEKLRSNPALELGAPGAFDEMAVGEPAVWSSAGSYWMLYTGSNRGKQRSIGLAQSGDGVRWERVAGFKPVAGDQPWNRQVLCDPTVAIEGSAVRVWFGGGDVPSPDENLHGQIGMGVLNGSQ